MYMRFGSGVVGRGVCEIDWWFMVVVIGGKDSGRVMMDWGGGRGVGIEGYLG